MAPNYAECDDALGNPPFAIYNVNSSARRKRWIGTSLGWPEVRTEEHALGFLLVSSRNARIRTRKRCHQPPPSAVVDRQQGGSQDPHTRETGLPFCTHKTMTRWSRGRPLHLWGQCRPDSGTTSTATPRFTSARSLPKPSPHGGPRRAACATNRQTHVARMRRPHAASPGASSPAATSPSPPDA